MATLAELQLQAKQQIGGFAAANLIAQNTDAASLAAAINSYQSQTKQVYGVSDTTITHAEASSSPQNFSNSAVANIVSASNVPTSSTSTVGNAADYLTSHAVAISAAQAQNIPFDVSSIPTGQSGALTGGYDKTTSSPTVIGAKDQFADPNYLKGVNLINQATGGVGTGANIGVAGVGGTPIGQNFTVGGTGQPLPFLQLPKLPNITLPAFPNLTLPEIPNPFSGFGDFLGGIGNGIGQTVDTIKWIIIGVFAVGAILVIAYAAGNSAKLISAVKG